VRSIPVSRHENKDPSLAPEPEAPPDRQKATANPTRQWDQDTLSPTPAILSSTEIAGHEYAVVEGDAQNVVAGRRKAFEDCEEEQIHIPGAIQSFGVLVALGCSSDRKLQVRMVSENSPAIFQYSVKDLCALDSFLDALPGANRLEFETRAWSVKRNAELSNIASDPSVFSTAIQVPGGPIVPLCCAMHFVGDGRDLLVCEFEKEHRLDTTSSLPDHPVHTLDRSLQEPSTEPPKPAFPSKHSAMDAILTPLGKLHMQGFGLVAAIAHIQKKLSSAKSTEELCDMLVESVQDITKFHRIMVYRFDEALNGAVVAEVIDPRASGDSYKNLRFPASDIPAQARKLYQINKVRFLFDREEPTSRLVCRSVEDLEPALDLTHSYLRAMSPIHLKYLSNMGVRSTMSISLELEGRLWGLICCHSYGRPTILPFPIREICHWIGLCASSCLAKLNYSSKLESRKVLEALQTNKDSQTCVTASSDDILKLFDAASGFMVIQGEARSVGRHKSYQEALTLLRYVSMRRFKAVIACQSILADHPDLRLGKTFKSIAGFLFIPLSTASQDFLLVLRDHQVREVHWAGKPPSKAENNILRSQLEPRHSFNKWTEIIKGFCEKWTEEQCGHL
jgi:light-regulated signal transduction histidine kinase (bacteriophytochrome)